jgi:lipopolysaccharide transport system permease protein
LTPEASPAVPYRLYIEAGRRQASLDFHELWHYRDLLLILTWREISIRYRQTVLGSMWAILQPFLSMVVFSLFLGKLAHVPSDGVPYPVFSYLGLLPWTYFSNALSRSGASLVGNANLISKVYFPRVLIPLSATLSALVDFIIAAVVLGGLMIWYHVVPGPWTPLLLPLALLAAFLATGVGMWLAALNVKYRDVQHAVPFLIQLWMFATPVVYPASLVPKRWALIFELNPVTGIIEAFRAAALGHPIGWRALAISGVLSIAIFAIGLNRFRSMERTFADIV